MLRIGKQQNSIRLPEMMAIPSTEDLQFLLSKAQRNWRCSIELPFKTPDGLASFLVIVKCELGTGNPCWSLYRTDEADMPVVWSHVSTDMLLIHNLMSLEGACLRKNPVKAGDLHGQEFSFSSPINDADLEMPMSQSRAMSGQSPMQMPLTQSRIIQESSFSAQPRDQDVPEEPQLDPRVVQSVEWALTRPETGIFSYSALLYFLHQEFARFQRGGQPFTVIVFDLLLRTGQDHQELDAAALREAFARVASIKRTLDMIAHFEALEYAFLLPHTDAAGAAVFVERVTKVLTKTPLIPGTPANAVELYCGLASAPEDSRDPGLLLAAAGQAKHAARQKAEPLIYYRELKTA